MSMNNGKQTLLTTEEVAAILRVSENTVRRWVKVGILEGFKVPGTRRHRFRRSDIDRITQPRERS